jgi:hypothetical protein
MKQKNLCLCLLLLLLSYLTVCFEVNDPVWREKMSTDKVNVVGFYHLYANEGTNYHSVATQQFDVLDSSGLFDKLDAIYYTTSGDKSNLFRLQNPKFKFLHDWGPHGEETETLGLLYRFCRDHPSTKALYYHNRASLHNSAISAEFSTLADCFVLNPNCIDALTKYDTCGWRLSPVPQMHYLGHYYWAKCSYINELIDPLSSKINETFIATSQSLSECIHPSRNTHNDYTFVDSWVTTHPAIRPADCMSGSVDNSFHSGALTTSLGHSGSSSKYCPLHSHDSSSNDNTKFGSTCEEAAAMKHPSYFVSSFQNYWKTPVTATTGGSKQQECHQSELLEKEIVKRSELWYGQRPKTYEDWIAKLKQSEQSQFSEDDRI